MLPSLIRRSAQHAQQTIPYNVHLNPYRAKRLWPPDFAKLSPKQQFRLERKYKRRAKLKWARPRWTKFTKIVQMGAITFTLVYGVLFMDWSSVGNPNPNHKPFEGIRTWFFGLSGSMWSKDNLHRKEAASNRGSPSKDTTSA